MTKAEPVLWGIHGGRTGDADSLFLKHNRIALGWAEIGDLSGLKADRDAFRARVAATYPDKTPPSVANSAGQLFRFVHEMREGDFVVYPSQRDRQVHIGKIEGSYQYDPSIEAGYPNVRKVSWLKALPRTRFSQGALYEIGSAMSLFQVKNYAEEFRSALEKGPESPIPVKKDETVAAVVGDIEETTRDFLIKALAQELNPFAHFVGYLLNAMGYRCRISPEGTDGGIDIIAHKDELGFEPPLIKVQAKSSEAAVGDPVVSALYGKVGQGEFGLVVTLGTFTPAAKSFARSKTNLRLIDGEELVQLILQYYDRFDSKYRGILPLKRVYVPESLEETAD